MRSVTLSDNLAD